VWSPTTTLWWPELPVELLWPEPLITVSWPVPLPLTVL